jgi:glucokinase
MYIGLDIGGTNIKGVLLDGTKVRARVQYPTKSKTNKKILLNQIFKIIEILIRKSKNVGHLPAGRQGAMSYIKGIGVGVAGPVDFEKQKILDPPNVTALKNLELGKLIEKKFRIRTIIENDGHLMILAEAILGAGKNKNNIVGITLGTGVGGGIIIDKKIIHGKAGTAGEIGHMTIDKHGRKCNCGSKGCLETYISEGGIRKTSYEFFNKRIKSYDLHQIARKGDQKAIETWNEVGKHLGLGLANIVDILNPEIIIVGGGIARGAGELLMNPAKKEMRKNVLSESAKKTPVILAKLNEYAGAIGAGLLFNQ